MWNVLIVDELLDELKAHLIRKTFNIILTYQALHTRQRQLYFHKFSLWKLFSPLMFNKQLNKLTKANFLIVLWIDVRQKW